MRFHLKRHDRTQLYWWKEDDHDRLYDHEFISFQGTLEGFEIINGRTFALLAAGASIFYRRSGSHYPNEIKAKEAHHVEILGNDEVTFGPDMVLNTLNPNPIEVQKLIPETSI